MQFFLYEILARIVAIYLCFDCSRSLWSGLAERRITYFLCSGDVVDWLFTSPSKWTFERDVAPIRYWLTVGAQVFTLIACIVVAIFGWFHPNSEHRRLALPAPREPHGGSVARSRWA